MERKRVFFQKGFLDSLSQWKFMGDTLIKSLHEGFSEIESKERNLDSKLQSAMAAGMEADSLKVSLQKRFQIFEEREREFRLFQEETRRECALKEEEIGFLRDKFLEEIRVREEMFNDGVKLVKSLNERLDTARSTVEFIRLRVDEKLKAFKSREHTLGAARQSVAKREREVDLVEESLAKRLKVIEEKEKDIGLMKKRLEKREKGFLSFTQKKIKSLQSEKENFNLRREEFVQDVKIVEKRTGEQEKLVHKLLERLELAHNDVKNMKTVAMDRSRETNLIKAWVEIKMDELDSKAIELMKEEEQIKTRKDIVVSYENESEVKKRELELKEKDLDSWEKELEFLEKENAAARVINEQRTEELDWKEKNVNSVKEFARTCFKEHFAIKKQLESERKLVEKHARALEHEEEQLKCRLKEVESREKQIGENLKEVKLERQKLNNALNNLKIESNESADIHFVVKMDGKKIYKCS